MFLFFFLFLSSWEWLQVKNKKLVVIIWEQLIYDFEKTQMILFVFLFHSIFPRWHSDYLLGISASVVFMHLKTSFFEDDNIIF